MTILLDLSLKRHAYDIPMAWLTTSIGADPAVKETFASFREKRKRSKVQFAPDTDVATESSSSFTESSDESLLLGHDLVSVSAATTSAASAESTASNKTTYHNSPLILCPETCQELWYTKREISQMRKGTEQLLAMARSARGGSSTAAGRFHFSMLESDQFSMRGLEDLVSIRSSMEKKARKAAGLRAVLQEQARQLRHGTLNHETLRKRYDRASQEAREIALKLAKQDEAEAKRIISGARGTDESDKQQEQPDSECKEATERTAIVVADTTPSPPRDRAEQSPPREQEQEQDQPEGEESTQSQSPPSSTGTPLGTFSPRLPLYNSPFVSRSQSRRKISSVSALVAIASKPPGPRRSRSDAGIVAPAKALSPWSTEMAIETEHGTKTTATHLDPTAAPERPWALDMPKIDGAAAITANVSNAAISIPILPQEETPRRLVLGGGRGIESAVISPLPPPPPPLSPTPLVTATTSTTTTTTTATCPNNGKGRDNDTAGSMSITTSMRSSGKTISSSCPKPKKKIFVRAIDVDPVLCCPHGNGGGNSPDSTATTTGSNIQSLLSQFQKSKRRQSSARNIILQKAAPAGEGNNNTNDPITTASSTGNSSIHVAIRRRSLGRHSSPRDVSASSHQVKQDNASSSNHHRLHHHRKLSPSSSSHRRRSFGHLSAHESPSSQSPGTVEEKSLSASIVKMITKPQHRPSFCSAKDDSQECPTTTTGSGSSSSSSSRPGEVSRHHSLSSSSSVDPCSVTSIGRHFSLSRNTSGGRRSRRPSGNASDTAPCMPPVSAFQHQHLPQDNNLFCNPKTSPTTPTPKTNLSINRAAKQIVIQSMEG